AKLWQSCRRNASTTYEASGSSHVSGVCIEYRRLIIVARLRREAHLLRSPLTRTPPYVCRKARCCFPDEKNPRSSEPLEQQVSLYALPELGCQRGKERKLCGCNGRRLRRKGSRRQDMNRADIGIAPAQEVAMTELEAVIAYWQLNVHNGARASN